MPTWIHDKGLTRADYRQTGKLLTTDAYDGLKKLAATGRLAQEAIELADEQLERHNENQLAAKWEEFKADPKNAIKIAFGFCGFKRKIRAEERARLQECIVGVIYSGVIEGFEIGVEYGDQRAVLLGLIDKSGEPGPKVGFLSDMPGSLDGTKANSKPRLVAFAKRFFEIPRPEDWNNDLNF